MLCFESRTSFAKEATARQDGRQCTRIFHILTIQSQGFLPDRNRIKPVSIRNDTHSRFFAYIRGSKIPSLVALEADACLIPFNEENGIKGCQFFGDCFTCMGNLLIWEKTRC